MDSQNVNRKIVIAQVVGKPTGGVMSCVLNFYRNIDRSRYKFVFFTYEKSIYDEEIKELGGETVIFPPVTKVFGSVKALKRLFKSKYDIVHVHLTTLSVFPLYAAKKAGVKIRICHAHTTDDGREKVFIAKRLLRPYAKTFATDLAGCSEYACRYLYGDGWKDAFVLHNAVDIERFAKTKASPKNIVGTVGRLTEQKNQTFLIDFFKEVKEKNEEVKLLIVGEGKLKKRLEKRIEKNGLADSAFILKERKDIENFYDEISVFVLPSLFEGLPIVAVEAQVKGLPCLLSDKITREADVGGKVYFLPLDKKTWAESVLYALTESRTVGSVSDFYDIKKEVIRLENYYERLIESSGK